MKSRSGRIPRRPACKQIDRQRSDAHIFAYLENTPVITGLIAKRASIESESAELERQIRRHRSEVMQIDSTNTTVRPEPAPGQARRKLVPAIGALHDRELTRRCQTAFREDKGRPLTADGIAVQAMKGKNLDMGDGALRQDITRRFMWTLAQMLKTGIVTKQGWGADARWGMPTGNWAGDTLI
jgi:hypothetical protein